MAGAEVTELRTLFMVSRDIDNNNSFIEQGDSISSVLFTASSHLKKKNNLFTEQENIAVSTRTKHLDDLKREGVSSGVTKERLDELSLGRY